MIKAIYQTDCPVYLGLLVNCLFPFDHYKIYREYNHRQRAYKYNLKSQFV